MENAEDQFSDIETQLRALATADAGPRAADAALLERLMAKADAAAATATPTPWYRRAALWRKMAACVPLALVAGISALAMLHYLPLQAERSAHVKQTAEEPPTPSMAQYLPRTQADMHLPQGALVFVSAESAPGLAAVTITLRHHLTPQPVVQELSLNTEENAPTPVALLPRAVLPCAEDTEEFEAEAMDTDTAEIAAAEGEAELRTATRTVATYLSGSEAGTAEQPIAESAPTPLHKASRKRAAKKAAPARRNVGTRLRELIHLWQQEFSAAIKKAANQKPR